MSLTALQILSSDKNPIPISHTQYLSLLNEGQIESATVTGKEFSGKLFQSDSLLNNMTNKFEYHNSFITTFPYEISNSDVKLWNDNNITITANEPSFGFFDYLIQFSPWILIIFLSIYINSFLPIFLFLIPKFFATLYIVWGLTQHMGLKEDTKDYRHSTRSVRLNSIFSFIYWKMEHHIEHHMFPTVPSYNLSKLHALIKNQMPPAKKGLWGAYKEILPAIFIQAKNPNYKISLSVPK